MSTSFLDKSMIQNLQDGFADPQGLYAICYQRPFIPLTSCSGASEEFLAGWISHEEQRLLVASFSESDIENVIEWESKEHYAKVSALAIRDEEGNCAAVWIFLGLCEDLAGEEKLPEGCRRTTESAFDAAIGMMERISALFFAGRSRELALLKETETRKPKDEAISKERRRSEIVDDLLTLLSSEREFSGIIRAILRVCGEYLSLDAACIIRAKSGFLDQGSGAELVAQWRASEEVQPLPEVLAEPERDELPFFTGKPYTISSGAVLPENFDRFFSRNGLSAGVFLPVNYRGECEMYLCFLVYDGRRSWDVRDLAFLNDAGKILEMSYFTRVTDGRFSQLYGALDDILAHLGTGLLVLRELEQDGIYGSSARDSKQEILYKNEQFEEELRDPRDRQRFEDALVEIGDFKDFEFFAEQASRWYAVHPSKVRWVDGLEANLYVLIDISESKNVAQELKKRVITDDLTGLYNRKRFMEDFAVVIRDAVRSGDSGALLYINLDSFTAINGGLGQTFGDSLLRETAGALLAAAGGGASCYRLGGDEFAVLVPFYEYDNLRKLVGTIERRFAQPWNLNGREQECTMSMGVVSFPGDGVDRDELLKAAKSALDLAKQNGRGHAEFFDAKGNEDDLRRLRLEKAMRTAVDAGCGEFEVYYQPMIDASKDDRPCIGAEALVRWNSAELGFVRPDNFIPMAEYTGMIVPIGAHVMRTACAQCKRWNDFGHPDFEININVSGVQFMNDDIVDTVNTIIEQTGINPRNMILEITESVAIRDMDKLKESLTSLRELGIRISLDDFGTGYSSLNRLKELPLDEIKIDKSFVDDLTEDEFSGKFVETVTDLADTINLDVVVEGVEHKEQADELENMKVDLFQGYLFDKPLKQQEFEEKYLG